MDLCHGADVSAGRLGRIWRYGTDLNPRVQRRQRHILMQLCKELCTELLIILGSALNYSRGINQGITRRGFAAPGRAAREGLGARLASPSAPTPASWPAARPAANPLAPLRPPSPAGRWPAGEGGRRGASGSAAAPPRLRRRGPAGAMEAALRAVPGGGGGGGAGLWSASFWRRLSGPEEQRALELLSYGLGGCMAAAAVVGRTVRAPYGRYSSAALGGCLPARLAWAAQEAPSFLLPLLLVLRSDGAQLPRWPNRILLGLFLAHYAYRSFVYPFLIRGGKPTPVITCLLAFVFCCCNGYLQGRSLSNYAEYPSSWLKEPRFILGVAGWISGLLINVHSDHILVTLRKPGETGYKIPRGGLFEYVSGANFFGEIIEWFGFALASCTVESAVFAMSTFLILGTRAQHHHQWYLQKFENYPQSRKILIPFVY
uniref:3-oxo-5-alpha-steroid 4-dehydrogenase 1 n=1 Tax=Euleptes europaea TaxID=460621 RepID=UPI0025406F81|nr:3-oxo-5-alpha-steroid 4-dehydrogenase 1 [Euleptes europaea]